MEDKFLVAKTILECYPHLDDLYDALTESSDGCVRSGFYAIFPKEQLRLYARIAECENRKVGIYNMKYLVEECFRRGRSVALSLLKEKYIFGRSVNAFAERYGVSLRTCYRYLKKGIAEFTSELEEMGYDKRRILTEYGDEPLFQTMLTRVIREDDAEGREESAQKASLAINNRRTPLPPNDSGRGRCYL